MYIYNVTIKLDPSIEATWLQWMQEEHLKEVIGTGMFHKYIFSQLTFPVDPDDGITYVVQYFTDSKAKYEQYLEEFAPGLRQKGQDKFQDKFIGFRSFLEVIEG